MLRVLSVISRFPAFRCRVSARCHSFVKPLRWELMGAELGASKAPLVGSAADAKKLRFRSFSRLLLKDRVEKLELFEELAGGAGDVDAAGDTALTVLDALDDAGGLGALRAIGALVSIHDLLTVAGLGNLRHLSLSMFPADVALMRLEKA